MIPIQNMNLLQALEFLIQTVLSTSLRSYGGPDVLAFPIFHTEGVEDITWDFQFKLSTIDDQAFAAPVLTGDTTDSIEGLSYRKDYKGVPGAITALTADGVATKLSEVDASLRSGLVIVPLTDEQLAALVPGAKYILRIRQKARGEGSEWSVYHDQIIVW